LYRDCPSASTENLPAATQLSDEILCLPVYPHLAPADQDRVIEILRQGAESPQ